ncbi:MAG: aldo/keto reductase [Pseudomonadota bacterium]|nr:aldo/keto reductase [Pseudomonadota bacterium]
MKMNRLGNSDLVVSRICLGTMTWGQQNNEKDAHEQLAYATANGINFIDTAEMYAVPPTAESYGKTEAYIGSWLKKQQRDKLIVASKIAGPRADLTYMRGGSKVNKEQVDAALHDSLKRLQTNYLDLYQIHWPDRNTPIFGAYQYDPKRERETTPIREQLEALAVQVKSGKIRYVGLSNETPWGLCQFTRMAEQHNLPRVVSIQNAYSLLNRTFEYGLAEACHRENVGLLAYSPLAFGHLTGKYLTPEGRGRCNIYAGFGQRYEKVNGKPASQAYVDLAQKYGMSGAALALAFVNQRWFTTSNIVGATTIDQLKENIQSEYVTLSDECLKEIEGIHLRYTNPAP